MRPTYEMGKKKKKSIVDINSRPRKNKAATILREASTSNEKQIAYFTVEQFGSPKNHVKKIISVKTRAIK